MQPFSRHLLGAFVFPQRHRLLNALVDELELAPNFDRFSDYDCFLADQGSSRHFAWPQSAARIAATRSLASFATVDVAFLACGGWSRDTSVLRMNDVCRGPVRPGLRTVGILCLLTLQMHSFSSIEGGHWETYSRGIQADLVQLRAL